MAKLIVTGERPLKGSVRISGAKNAALPIMAASILTEGPSVLTGVPHLRDVQAMRAMLEALGVRAERISADELRLQVVRKDRCSCPEDLACELRASICLLGPLLARRGRAEIPLPGGCSIGPRPIDLHLKGLAALGAELMEQQGCVVATARRLKGARINLAGPRGSTVLGTANVMMAACLAEGITVIEQAACEPELENLADYLNACGGRVSGAGTPTIQVEGVEALKGAAHAVIPDRIETGTFAAARRGL